MTIELILGLGIPLTYLMGMFTSFYFLVKWDESFQDGSGSYYAFCASLIWPVWFPFFMLHRKATKR